MFGFGKKRVEPAQPKRYEFIIDCESIELRKLFAGWFRLHGKDQFNDWLQDNGIGSLPEEPVTKAEFTSADEKFLKSLKIRW